MAINIQVMKKRLEDRQAELQKDIANLSEANPATMSIAEPSDAPQDFEEAAVDATEMQQEQSVEVNQQALLSEIKAALKRIEDGTYGKCVDCGQDIPEKRLEALPWAARCLKHEAELEQKNLSREELYDTDTL